jgi:hypothetical protein
VDRHPRDPTLLGEVDEREEVPVEPVHAARADQPEQVQRPAVSLDLLARGDERRVLEERAVGDRLRDADHVLEHASAGTQVQVADLAVPHLTLG